jgi:hypothetical protein
MKFPESIAIGELNFNSEFYLFFKKSLL